MLYSLDKHRPFMMRKIEAENLVFQRIESVLKGAKSEDSIVELKTSLIDPKKCARQIAALCNSVPGDDAFWVIGVDEDGKFEVPTEELANWSDALGKHFDGDSPSTRVYHTDFDGHPITLLHFSTESRPFVTKREDSGEMEVPWRTDVPYRHLNKTRNATRRELLRLFMPTVTLPSPEILQSYVYLNSVSTQLEVGVVAYITPANGLQTAIPAHKCQIKLDYGSSSIIFPPAAVLWTNDLTERSLEHHRQFVFNEPTFIRLYASGTFPELQDVMFPQTVSVLWTQGFAGVETAILMKAVLAQTASVPRRQVYQYGDQNLIL